MDAYSKHLHQRLYGAELRYLEADARHGAPGTRSVNGHQKPTKSGHLVDDEGIGPILARGAQRCRVSCRRE
jgi:hypothetical protein